MVKVDDLPLTLVYDEHGRVVYQVDEASRFGEKIAEGDPKYADFAPFESASAIARFDGTYGLRRFSDSLDPKKDGNATDEPDGMDCSYGLPIMEPGQHVEALPGSDQAVLWLGEFTPAATGAPGLLAIAGTRVYRRIGVGVWSQITTLPASPGTDARVTTFNGRLIIGFGDAHVAIWTDDLTTWPNVQDDLGGPIYIWACTADHSNVYVAGGPALADHNQVMSSTTGNDYADGVDCGRPDIYIHSLAPGGGLVLVYIGKQNELGCLTNAATYQILIPFDTYEANNGHLLRWWLGRQDDQQRGPLALHFLREQHLWQYAPASDTTGEARDITPWADPTRRPYAIKGLPTAAAGTHRWLYYAVTNMDGATWVLKRDAMTGSTTPYLSLGKRACRALVVTHQLGLNPCLMYGYGEHVAYSVVPLYGEWPLDDPNVDYRVGTATLSLPAFDLNLPDEDKILLSVRIIADNLDPVARYFEVEYAVDGGPWLALGLANLSPRSEIDFDREIDIMKAKRCALRLIAHNLDGATTMVLLGVVLHWSLNAKPYRRWTFQASLPVGRTQLPGSDSSNPERVLAALWNLRADGVPFVFVDRWKAQYITRLLTITELGTTQPHDRAPDTEVQLQLLQTTGNLPASYTRHWYMPPMTCEWFPITACWPEVCAGSLVIESDVTNDLGSETIYPRWTIHGPCGAVDIRNLTSGEWLTVVRDVSFAESLVINMDPARQTVVDSVGRAIPTAQVFGTFWGLQPGLVAFRVVVDGASLGTYVVATRRP